MSRLLLVARGFKSDVGGVVRMSPCRLDCPCSSQRRQSVGAHWFSSTQKVGLSFVFLIKANPDVTNRVRTGVFLACHAVFAFAHAAPLKLAACNPDCPPLVECKQKLYLTSLCSILLIGKGIALRVLSPLRMVLARCLYRLFRISGAPSALLSAKPRAVIGVPRALIRTHLRSAILGISHWFCSSRTVVRGGAGAETPTPFRLYHALPQGAH